MEQEQQQMQAQPMQEEQQLQGQTKQQQPANGQDPQKAFDKLMVNALKVIHTEKTTDSFLQRIEASEDKVDALGEIGLDIIKRLSESANQNQFEIPLSAGLNGLNVIVGEVASVAEAAGVAQYDEEQKYQAFSWAISNYIDQAVKTGQLSKDELIQAGDKIQGTPEGGEIVKSVMDAQGGQ